MNVLSLFDGISCGMVALERAGIKVDNYFSSEIDKYAITISERNYPNIIRLGDVTKWREWNLPQIDLLVGGSPCQGFSNAGEGLGFDDPRSKLFFEYVEIRNELMKRNPNLKFLLENVRMKKKEWTKIITSCMGVELVEIDSALVSAQSRKRLYWANWDIGQPEDRGIVLKDIIESGEVDRDKSYCIDANYFKGGSDAYLKRIYHGKAKRQVVRQLRQSERRLAVKEPVQVASIYPSNGIAGRIYSPEGKSPSLRTATGGNHMPKVSMDDYHYRKLTPVECERLQTLRDGYTEGVSNTRRYQCLGNGWTVDVIAHIFEELKKDAQWTHSL